MSELIGRLLGGVLLLLVALGLYLGPGRALHGYLAANLPAVAASTVKEQVRVLTHGFVPADRYPAAGAGRVVGVTGGVCPEGWIRYRVDGRPLFVAAAAVLDAAGSAVDSAGRPYRPFELLTACVSRGTP